MPRTAAAGRSWRHLLRWHLLQDLPLLLGPAERVLIVDAAILVSHERLAAEVPQLVVRREQCRGEIGPRPGRHLLRIEPFPAAGSDMALRPRLQHTVDRRDLDIVEPARPDN